MRYLKALLLRQSTDISRQILSQPRWVNWLKLYKPVGKIMEVTDYGLNKTDKKDTTVDAALLLRWEYFLGTKIGRTAGGNNSHLESCIASLIVEVTGNAELVVDHFQCLLVLY